MAKNVDELYQIDAGLMSSIYLSLTNKNGISKCFERHMLYYCTVILYINKSSLDGFRIKYSTFRFVRVEYDNNMCKFDDFRVVWLYCF